MKATIDTATYRIDVPPKVDILKINDGVEGQTERANDISHTQETNSGALDAAIGQICALLADLIGEMDRQCRPAAEADDVDQMIALLPVFAELVIHLADSGATTRAEQPTQDLTYFAVSCADTGHVLHALADIEFREPDDI